MTEAPETQETFAQKARNYQSPNLTAEKVIDALEATGGIRFLAAERLKVSRITLWRWLNDNPAVKAHIHEVDEDTLDLAEATVLRAMRDGDVGTARWFLDRKGKRRGYGYTTEVSGPKGGAIPVEGRVTLDTSKLATEILEALVDARVAEDPDAGPDAV